MTATWVVGAGGLLGSAVHRAAGPAVVTSPVRWNSDRAHADLTSGVDSLVRAADGAPWRILWCAGAATTSSPRSALDAERRSLQSLLRAVERLPESERNQGILAIASSAGGVYGGSTSQPFTEETPPRPLGDYGAAKLALEDDARRFATDTGVRVVLARIANLYGPGQNLTKPQGLISRLAISAITRRPLSIFVPLDTLRDYVFVDDAAAVILAATDRARSEATPANVKIVASGRSTSIAAILAEFGRVTGRRPAVVAAVSADAALQGRDLRLLSTIWPDLGALATTTLPSGISRTLEAVRRRWAAGGLPPGVR